MDADFRPHIGISCRRASDPLNLLHLYGQAISEAGGNPMYLYPEDGLKLLPGDLGGLLIPGGRDIPPRHYGEDCLHDMNPEDEERISHDILTLESFLKYNKPVFGICYGMQLINVFFGGSLYQDIGSQVSHALDHRSGYHDISVSLNPFIPSEIRKVNSSHHQAIKAPGTGLLPAAYSPDGIMEAFYGEGRNFLAGVQWHPERLNDKMSRQMLEGFVSACIPL